MKWKYFFKRNVVLMTSSVTVKLVPHTAKKMKIFIKDFFSGTNPPEAILNGKLHFFCGDVI